MNQTILLIEDTKSMQLVYAAVLRSAGYTVHTAGTAQEGYELFALHRPDAVLLDLQLPDRDGLDLMRDLLGHRPEPCVVVITANGSINRAVEAMRAGAHEFLVKPFDQGRMLAALGNAVEDARRKARDEAARPSNGSRTPAPKLERFEGFIGTSAPMQQVYAKIGSVARSMATIFISGESGTGKEVCAQAVHDCSARASGPFVPLNCGAIPSELLESEVFGHLKGSFTGAISDKLGAAAAADGGTLFLDEICEMDLSLQTKMLRFLQTSTIQPVGAATPRKINVRIVCATNRDPMEEVKAGRFRQDLFYRLHVVPIHLPPLRDRGDDVIEIAEAELVRMSDEEGRAFVGLDPEVKALFRNLPWPGNVRQLLNALRNVVVLHEGTLVTRAMLPDGLLSDGLCARKTVPKPQLAPTQPEPVPNGHWARAVDGMADGHPALPIDGHGTHVPPLTSLRGKTLAEIERIVIEDTIARHGGSVPRAARELGVSPSTIYRKRDAWSEAEDDDTTEPGAASAQG